ncbi:MAG: redox-sensing transcriptional repressor Rex [Ruminococcaceae bacterium]|nr:redox-sensing transcriptional repressor Rex [Oscillospiraceae bacterium]
MPKSDNISMSVIKRMPRYYRFLGKLKDDGVIRISSRELSKMMGFTASQIRQDLNCFGGFGQQGYGYNVEQLYDEIGAILGVNTTLNVILVGAGNLGHAIASHMEFERRGFRLIGAFDENPKLIGGKIKNTEIFAISSLEDFCAQHKPTVAIVCVPTGPAARIVERLYNCGIRGFWNYSHYDILSAFPDAIVENVHLSDSLLTLSYQIKSSAKNEE